MIRNPSRPKKNFFNHSFTGYIRYSWKRSGEIDKTASRKVGKVY